MNKLILRNKSLVEIIDQGKKIQDIIRNQFLDKRIDRDGDMFYEYGIKSQKYLKSISDQALMNLKVYIDALKGTDLGGYRENDQQRTLFSMVEIEINNRTYNDL